MYYKIVEEGYIIAIGRGDYGSTITKAEYNKIKKRLTEKPEVGPHQVAKLRDGDLLWEIVEWLV